MDSPREWFPAVGRQFGIGRAIHISMDGRSFELPRADHVEVPCQLPHKATGTHLRLASGKRYCGAWDASGAVDVLHISISALLMGNRVDRAGTLAVTPRQGEATRYPHSTNTSTTGSSLRNGGRYASQPEPSPDSETRVSMHTLLKARPLARDLQ